jgi:CheY-like chemotaxis protein
LLAQVSSGTCRLTRFRVRLSSPQRETAAPHFAGGADYGKTVLSFDPDHPAEPGGADLTGMRVLVVEDSRELGIAMQSLLQACGATVAGPVATAAEADRLIAESLPDAALVDIQLRFGERADALIARLHDRGVRVIVTSGDAALLRTPTKAAAMLSKPFGEAELFAALLPPS